MNRTTPPVQQAPVNRTVPPVQQPMNRTTPPMYHGAAPMQATTYNRAGNAVYYHQNGMQTRPAAKNGLGIIGVLLNLLPILLIIIAIMCEAEVALILVGISLAVSLLACILSVMGIRKAGKCGGNGRASSVLGTVISVVFMAICLLLVLVLVIAAL